LSSRALGHVKLRHDRQGFLDHGAGAPPDWLHHLGRLHQLRPAPPFGVLCFLVSAAAIFSSEQSPARSPGHCPVTIPCHVGPDNPTPPQIAPHPSYPSFSSRRPPTIFHAGTLVSLHPCSQSSPPVPIHRRRCRPARPTPPRRRRSPPRPSAV
jgi:hypothetical protein